MALGACRNAGAGELGRVARGLRKTGCSGGRNGGAVVFDVNG